MRVNFSDDEWLRSKALTSVVAVPVGFGLAVGIAFVAFNFGALRVSLIGQNWGTSLPAWVQAVGSIGAIVAAWFLSNQQHQREVRAVHTAASFEIAVQLQQWEQSIQSVISEQLRRRTSSGTWGRNIWEVPEFRFESRLERIAMLPPGHAKLAFRLVKQRQAAAHEARLQLDTAVPGNAILFTWSSLKTIYPEAISLCQELERSVGWELTPVSERATARIGFLAAADWTEESRPSS
ncbi:hypothetical protein [Dongia sedimenti]|uniref:Uncharacterized protein n=1 Tax=Dongia sedimenti TaxID=3064282 RepID=A0ABU0YWX3_9PROT|nr:hypothetical protein [Rhodospirillaceae bacterium R-7]